MTQEIQRRLTAIVCADVVGYSALMGKDETGTLAALQGHRNEHIDPTISEYGGRIVKTMGDGLLLEFPSAVAAVQCAVAVQQGMVKRNMSVDNAQAIRLRIGVHVGDIIIEQDDIFGDGVNIAARVEPLADTDGVSLSDDAYRQVRDRLDFTWRDGGRTNAKNIARPLRIWHWCGAVTNAVSPNDTNTEQPPDKPSVAVLPFNNMSGDTEQEYFSDGITEDIITDLSKISALFVIARNTTFAYKDRPQNLQEVANELSVGFLVEGSVRKSGNRVRITAQLIDGKTGGHLWAERYDRDLIDIFDLQDEITLKIVSALKVMLQPGERVQSSNPRTRIFDAYDLYLRGRRLQNKHTKPSLNGAIALFEQAINIDPDYARAHCGIADCSATLSQYYGSSPELEAEIAKRSLKALELAPDLAEAYATKGFAFSLKDDYAGAETAFTRAVTLDPNLYEAHYYWGNTCFSQGKLQEAADHLYDAMAASPQDLQAPGLLIQVLGDLGRFEEMTHIAGVTVDNALRKFERDPTNVRACLGASFGYFRMGKIDAVKRQIAKAKALDPEDSIINYNMACLYSLIGEKKEALHFLTRAVNRGMRHRAWLDNDSDLDNLRKEPEFVTLMEGLPPSGQ